MDERIGDGFFCHKDELPAVLEKAEKDKTRVLKEFAIFYPGDVDIEFAPVSHFMGWSVTAILTVNGQPIREYQSPELCFMELHTMMFERLREARER